MMAISVSLALASTEAYPCRARARPPQTELASAGHVLCQLGCWGHEMSGETPESD